MLQAIEAMSSIKLDQVLRAFNPSSSTEFSEWIKKFSLVAKSLGWSDLHNQLPLFLEGAAFAVYDQLSEEKKKDFNEIKAAITSAFSLSSTAAYAQFVSRRLQMGESIDVLISDLRRLLSLCGVKQVEDANVTPLLREQFLAALPTEICMQVKSSTSASEINVKLEVLAECAKRVIACSGGVVVAAVTINRPRPPFKPGSSSFCYKCKQSGHTVMI